MKITGVKKLSHSSHLNLYSIAYRDTLDQDKAWIFASRSRLDNPLERDHGVPDAVVVVPYHTDEDKLVVIREFRVVLGDYQYGFPAGLVDDNETPAHAGARELHEETGLRMTRILGQSPALFSSSGLTDETVGLLFVECDGTPSGTFAEASEDIEVVLLSREEAGALIQDTGLKFDVKTWIVLNQFAAHGTL